MSLDRLRNQLTILSPPGERQTIKVDLSRKTVLGSLDQGLLKPADVSGYVNLSWQLHAEPGADFWSVQLNPLFRGLGTIMRSNMNFSSEPSENRTIEEWQLFREEPDLLLRLSMGDTEYQSITGKSVLQVSGFHLEKDYNMAPNGIHLPDSRYILTLREPAQIRIYCNGLERHSFFLEEGRYELVNFTMDHGYNEMQIQVRGETVSRSVEVGFISDPELLREGEYQFMYSIGKPYRWQGNLREYPYETGIMSYHQWGLANQFLAGFAIENLPTVSSNFQSLNLYARWGLPLGLFTSQMGFSLFENQSGQRMALGFKSYPHGILANHFISMELAYQDASYQGLFGAEETVTQNALSFSLDDQWFLSQTFSIGALGRLSWLDQGIIPQGEMAVYLLDQDSHYKIKFGGGYANNQVDNFLELQGLIQYSYTLFGGKIFHIVSLTYRDFQNPATPVDLDGKVLIGYQLALGKMQIEGKTNLKESGNQLQLKYFPYEHDRIFWQTRIDDQDGENTLESAIYVRQKDHHFRARLYTENGDLQKTLSQVDYQQNGRWGMLRTYLNNEHKFDISMDTAFVFVDDYVAFGRPVRQNFVLVTAEDDLYQYDLPFQPRGVLDSSGPAMLSNLPLYRASSVKFDISSLPLGLGLKQNVFKLKPVRNGGYHIHLEKVSELMVMGKLLDENKDPIKFVEGTLIDSSRTKTPLSFVTNRRGGFQLFDIVPGKYKIELPQYKANHFEIKPDSAGIIKLPPFIMERERKRAE